MMERTPINKDVEKPLVISVQSTDIKTKQKSSMEITL
jgi:hypothetical protein